MRVYVLTALGAVVVAAGLAVPCGETVVAANGAEATGPGRRTEVVVPGCTGELSYAESPVFVSRVALNQDGTGAAQIRRNVRPGWYGVIAHCGKLTHHDVIEIRPERAWKGLLPAPLAS